MNDPVRDVPQIVHDLTQSTPSVQRQTIEKYFTDDASFVHPFVRTGSYKGSRVMVHAIFRWYKIMSPRIDLTINSIAFDSEKLILFINISQVFRIWVVPFYKAPVTLTTVLHLRRNDWDAKYYIASQEDLYQVNEFVRFFLPGGFILVWLWQTISAFGCFALAFLFWPVSWVEEHGKEILGSGKQSAKTPRYLNPQRHGNGSLVTSPALQQR